jgi:hypothetical protein
MNLATFPIKCPPERLSGYLFIGSEYYYRFGEAGNGTATDLNKNRMVKLVKNLHTHNIFVRV